MKNKNITNVKGNKGFTTADIVTSIIIIMLFIGLISTLFYNYYLTTSAKNRNAIATNCLIDVIEQVKMMEYDEVDLESVQLLINSLQEDKTIPNGYTLTPQLQNYNQTEGNLDKKDLIKILTLNVEFSVGDKTEKIEISTLIIKE